MICSSPTDGQKGRRAVSVVIGVMLMLSILFLAAAQYQIVVVPQQEETTEIDHYRAVSDQMSQLRTNILSASAIDSTSTQKITMGATYSRDLIFGIIPEIHATNPSGRIFNEDYDSTLKLENVKGLGSAENYWPGIRSPCAEPNHCFETSSLNYKVNYNQYNNNPQMVYENTIIYDKYENSPTTIGDDEYSIHSDQNLINGRSINLIALTGTLQQSRVSATTIESVPVSAPAQAISIEQNSSDPIIITVPTSLPEQIWENQVLADQIRTPSNTDGYIEEIRTGSAPNTIEIELLPDQTYNLKLSRVHLTSREDSSSTPIEKAAYVAWKGNERISIRENATTEIVAQVRDRYNNPVAGVETKVEARTDDNRCIGDFRSATASCPGGQQQPGRVTSGNDGSLAYFYQAPDVGADTGVSINIDLDDPENTYTPKIAKPPVKDTIRPLSESRMQQLSATAPTVIPLDEQYKPAARLGGTSFMPFPRLRNGYLDPPLNTIRVIDFELQSNSATAGQKVPSIVTIDNTGFNTRTVLISPRSNKSIKTNPNQYQITIEPGERRRVGFDIQFNNSGTHNLNINGVAGYRYNVKKPRSDILNGLIKNRIQKENINKSPSVFKDGDATNAEFQEDRNIPPVKYDNISQKYIDTSVGNLFNFNSIGQTDKEKTIIKGDKNRPIDKSVNVGLSTSYVADNNVYTFFIKYTFTMQTEHVQLRNVDTFNEKVDPASEYYLSTAGKGNSTQRAFQLTPKEKRDLQQTNEFITTISNPQSTTYPNLQIDSVKLVSSENTLILTKQNTTIDPNTTTTESNTVSPGEPIKLKVNLNNTGTSVGETRLKLYEDNNSGTYTAVKSKTTRVNPSEVKTVEMTLYKTNPGTYKYRFGTQNTPESNPVTITVTNL